LIIEQANLTSLGHNLIGEPFHDHIEMYLMDFSKTSIKQSLASLYVQSYNSSSIYVTDSDLYSPRIEPFFLAYDFSSLTINSSFVRGMRAHDSSSFFITNSIIGLSVCDSSIIFVKKSSLNLELILVEASLNLTFSIGHINYWNLYINGTIQGIDFNLTVIDTKITGFGIGAHDSIVFIRDSYITGVESSGSSLISIENSTLDGITFFDSTSGTIADTVVSGGVTCRDQSRVTLERSKVKWVIAIIFGSPSVKLINSTTPLIEHYSGFLLIINSNIGRISYCHSNATIINSTLNQIKARWDPRWGSRKVTVWLINSQVDSLEILGDAVVYKGWYLSVTVTLNNRSWEGAYVEVCDYEGTLVVNGTTRYDGKIRFVLPEIIMWSGMKVEYVGNYVLKAM